MQWTVNFPVYLAGEIDGTVFSNSDGRHREVANVEIELVAEDGEVVARSKSQFDGFYLFERVRPGRYTVRAAPEVAARRGLVIEPRVVELFGGEITSGIDLVAGDRG